MTGTIIKTMNHSPTSTSSSPDCRKRPRSWKQRTTTAVVALLCCSAHSAAGFVGPTSHDLLRPSPSSSHYFRIDQEYSDFTTTTTNAAADDAALFVLHPRQPPNSASAASLKNRQHLPVWLSRSKSHLSETNLQALQQAMRGQDSFFTETETLKLAYAIEEAANGDHDLIAGAAEFCQILVETMEMGLNALVAAAFHYCSCVQARQEQAYSSCTYNLRFQQTQIEKFGDHAVHILRDAARLKNLEMVAARVMMQSKRKRDRVRPDTRDAENLRKLLLSETRDWRGLAIRSAACLFRLRGLKNNNNKKNGDNEPHLDAEGARCAREALSIYAPLASRLGMHRLKNELEGAAFRVLYPRQYHSVTSKDAAGQMEQSMNDVLNNVKNEMTSMLEDDDEFTSLVENFSVTARVKEPYSMWKKMLRDGYKHILQVPDALALRIVLDAKRLTDDEPDEVTRARERALCYYAQKLCLQRWKPLEGNPRFKDYIEQPKANGYQSLHYTARTEWEDKDWTLEIQIRSGEMHQVAEFGLASHWDYKSSQQQKPEKPDDDVWIEKEGENIDQSSDAYLRKVQEWHWQQHAGVTQWDASPASFEPVILSDIWQGKDRADRIRERTQRLEPYIQALTAAQSDLTRQHVFVFLTHSQDEEPSEGKVLALPAGACVIDALREGENTFGCPLSMLEEDLALNGASTPITRQLHNGDVLTVPLCRTTPPPVAV